MLWRHALDGALLATTVLGVGTRRHIVSSPREMDRGLSISWEFRCLQQLVGPGGVLRDDPAAERWEAGMPKCMNRIPVGLQWLYYTGPYRDCPPYPETLLVQP